MRNPNEHPVRCELPYISACTGTECLCVQAPLPREPVVRCTPPAVQHCAGSQCLCAIPPPVPILLQPALPEDGCAVVLSILVVGVTKTLLACWVDG